MSAQPSRFGDRSRSALFVGEALGERPSAQRLAALRAEPILIAIDSRHANTRRGQLMVVTAANVIGRLFDFAPALDVDAGPARVLRDMPGLRFGRDLAAQTVSFLASLSPTPDRYAYRSAASSRSYLAALVIGGERPSADVAETIWVDGDAWTARVGPEPDLLEPSPTGSFNPFGPLVAAALGAVEVAKCVFRRLSGPAGAASFARLVETVTWDLWRHEFGVPANGPALPADLALGRVALAGLGALGSAAAIALAQIEGARGEVELIDDDRLSDSNLERVLTARAADVGREKVRVAAAAFRTTRLRPLPIAQRYGVAAPRRSRAEAILAGVDSGGARRQIMNSLPHSVYNGGTQGSELFVSRHVGLQGPCLECLYPEPVSREDRIARQLGVDRGTAAALVSGARVIDGDVLAAMERRGGVRFESLDPRALLDRPLAALEAYTCSRAVVIEDLPQATISFVSALCGFLMALELVKDRTCGARAGALDATRAALRLDVLHSIPGPACVESYVPRRDCFCQSSSTRRRFLARWGRCTPIQRAVQ